MLVKLGFTVTVGVLAGGAYPAVTIVPVFSVTVHVAPLALVHPLQAEKALPPGSVAGAVNVTVVPAT
jgi:hypothetical protein